MQIITSPVWKAAFCMQLQTDVSNKLHPFIAKYMDTSSIFLLFNHPGDISPRNGDVDSDESVASVVME